MLNLLLFEFIDLTATVIAALVVTRSVVARPVLSPFRLVAGCEQLGEPAFPQAVGESETTPEPADPNLGIEWPDASWPTSLAPWEQNAASAVGR
jgi:hypothetical protein